MLNFLGARFFTRLSSILVYVNFGIKPRAVGILHYVSLIIQNWLVSKAFANIFHDLNFKKNIYDNFRDF